MKRDSAELAARPAAPRVAGGVSNDDVRAKKKKKNVWHLEAFGCERTPSLSHSGPGRAQRLELGKLSPTGGPQPLAAEGSFRGKGGRTSRKPRLLAGGGALPKSRISRRPGSPFFSAPRRGNKRVHQAFRVHRPFFAPGWGAVVSRSFFGRGAGPKNEATGFPTTVSFFFFGYRLVCLVWVLGLVFTSFPRPLPQGAPAGPMESPPGAGFSKKDRGWFCRFLVYGLSSWGSGGIASASQNAFGGNRETADESLTTDSNQEKH
ncbi:uncharacterized protein TM35_000031180 [Trypanosoma theileri]|uniref:Uncharacterized protein n=1 Tax=Trypanosoma theileri TaxID=67003 RepID=A0A1X0P665_9TRYP|nr:uncharacterized protein TM35_000031180 [Trypanosoma theileri]ORC92365.1 hypothetical protein TM35_000031180 [Trypanosoma theileri]